MPSLFKVAKVSAVAIAILHPAVAMRQSIAAYNDPMVLVVETDTEAPVTLYPVQQLRSEFTNHELETRTPWSGETRTMVFRGPRVADILERHGLLNARSVQFVAYDNFIAEVLLDEIVAYDPILAIERQCNDDDRADGRCAADHEFTLLSTDDQGPIFLVWPYERLPSAYIPARNSIWVWFVVAIRPTS